MNTEQEGEDDHERGGARTMMRAGMRTRTGVSARARRRVGRGSRRRASWTLARTPPPHWASAEVRRTMRGTHAVCGEGKA